MKREVMDYCEIGGNLESDGRVVEACVQRR